MVSIQLLEGSMFKEIIDNASSKMESSCGTLKQDLSSLRTNKASASILDGVIVNVYNNNVRLNQIATVSVLGNKMLTVSVWDKGNVGAVNKAIINSNLNLSPIVEGVSIKIPLPELSAERRKELVKVAQDYAERTKVALRNIRRDGIAQLKDLNKNKDISDDELHRAMDEMQKLTNNSESSVDKLINLKTKEIVTV